MPRPKLKDTPVAFTARLPGTLVDAVKCYAHEHGLDRSAAVVHLLEAALKAEDPDRPFGVHRRPHTPTEVSPAQCLHPVTRRVADTCMLCGASIKPKK